MAALYRWRSAGFDWAQFFGALTRLDPLWLTLSIILMLLTYWVRVLRWEVMLRPLCPHPSRMGICSATVIGFTAVVVLGRAGELVRPYLIAIKERVPFPSQMASWLLERILDSIAVLLIFGCALALIPGRELHLGPGLSWVLRAGGYIIGAICSVCVLFLAVFRNFSDSAQTRILAAVAFLPERVRERIRESMGAFARGMQSTRDREILVRLLLYTVLEWLVILASFYALFRSFAATRIFGWTETVIFVGFICLGSIVQIPGIGGGVQVVSIVVLREIFGKSLEVSSGLAILIWLLSFASIVPLGVLFAIHEGMNWTRFKQLAEDVPS